MISADAFQHQLQKSIVPLLTRWKRCYQLSNVSNASINVLIYLPIKPHHSIELQILYSPVYQEPQLIFRIWSHETVDDIETQRICFPDDLHTWLNIQDFTIRLDYLHPSSRDVWYSVHGCDTADIVGSELKDYLKRWASIFLTIFDSEVSLMFL
ncbi:LAFA_0D12574g1_1 [Lachancea sp. 'fantastica']|nr:LAFA_0D12574g1_1 [Lachancea sp. 'fantastica']